MSRRKLRKILLLVQCVYHILPPVPLAVVVAVSADNEDDHERHGLRRHGSGSSSGAKAKAKAKEQQQSFDHNHNKEERRRELVIDGLDAKEGEFPFFVYYENYWGFSRCGGTLVSPTRVLTAAHCLTQLFGIVTVPSKVRIGNTNPSNGETIKVDCASIHPNFLVGGGDKDNRASYYDFAILKLASPAKTSSFVTLNSDPNYPSTTGQELISMGFGVTKTFWAKLFGPFSLPMTASSQDTLKKKPSTFLSAESCHEESKCIDSNYHVCTISGLCYGDSGGPLLDSNNLQVGVASFLADGVCESSNRGAIFANVAGAYDWIQNELTSSSCDDCFTFTFESPCPVAGGDGCSNPMNGISNFGLHGIF